MDDILVSVIIPAYNCANLICQALDSALIQDVPLEIIVINDGSADESESICKALQNEHENIIYIHKENE